MTVLNVYCNTMVLSNMSQGLGEQVARSIFPETTLVRPAPMFGNEDNLLLKLASVLNLFTANNMQEKFWPVHVSESYLLFLVSLIAKLL